MSRGTGVKLVHTAQPVLCACAVSQLNPFINWIKLVQTGCEYWLKLVQTAQTSFCA